MTPFEKIELFKSKCISAFGERLECLVLTGSYARGDYISQSDIDIWVLIKNLCLEDIQKVGEIVTEIGKTPEINPQCTSIAELKYKAFRDQFDPVQLYIGSQMLYGSLPDPAPSESDILNYALSLASFSLMSARHYLAVNETEESLSKCKLLKWVIRPFVWALRYRIFCKTSKYPRKLEDLTSSLTDVQEKEIVWIFGQLLSGKFKGNYKNTVSKVGTAAEKFITNH